MRLNARIGVVHLGSDAVTAALVKTGGVPAVLGYRQERILGALPEMDPAEVRAQALEKAIDGFAGQAESWVLCVDSAWSVARRLTIPFRGRSRVRPAVPFELEPHLAFPIEEVAVDYVVTAERARETEVLAIAVRRGVLEEQLAVCRAAGIAIEGIGLDVIGLTALFDQRYQNVTEPQVLLHVFEQNAALVVVERRKLKDFVMLPFGAPQLRQRPADAWRNIGNAVRSLDSVDRNSGEPLRVHVCGFEPTQPGIEADLPGNVDVLFEHELLPTLIAEDAADTGMRDMLAGTALAASGGGISLNFLDRALRAGDRAPGLSRRVRVAAALAIVLVTLFAVFRFAEYRANAARVDRLGQEVYELFAETFPDRPDAQTRPAGDIGGFKSFEAMLAAAEEEAEGRALFSPEAFQRPTLLDLLLDLSQRVPKNAVTITDMKISTGRYNEMSVYGQANSAEALNTMLRNLRESEIITLDERRLSRVSAGGRETFEFVARF